MSCFRLLFNLVNLRVCNATPARGNTSYYCWGEEGEGEMVAGVKSKLSRAASGVENDKAL